jgi:hypothetical protein
MPPMWPESEGCWGLPAAKGEKPVLPGRKVRCSSMLLLFHTDEQLMGVTLSWPGLSGRRTVLSFTV